MPDPCPSDSAIGNGYGASWREVQSPLCVSPTRRDFSDLLTKRNSRAKRTKHKHEQYELVTVSAKRPFDGPVFPSPRYDKKNWFSNAARNASASDLVEDAMVKMSCFKALLASSRTHDVEAESVTASRH